jgi:hypothetical protein
LFQETTSLFTAAIALDNTNQMILEVTEVPETTEEVQDIPETTEEVQDIPETTEEVQDIPEMTEEVQDHLREESHVKTVLVPENQEVTNF